jgi:Gp157 protein
MGKIDVDQLRLRIDALNREYPELSDDEVLRSDVLEGATDMNDVLVRLVEEAITSKSLVIAITDRFDRLAERRARIRRRVDFLRGLILQIMQAANLKKIELPEVTLIQRASQPQIVGEVDADALPDDLVTIKREPNRTAIREALQAHRELPGLSLGNAPPSLQVNTR